MDLPRQLLLLLVSGCLVVLVVASTDLSSLPSTNDCPDSSSSSCLADASASASPGTSPTESVPPLVAPASGIMSTLSSIVSMSILPVLVGLPLMGLTYLVQRLLSLWQRLRFTRVEIEETSDAYVWLQHFLLKHSKIDAGAKHVHVVIGGLDRSSSQPWWSRLAEIAAKTDDEKYAVSFRPAPGVTQVLHYTPKGTTKPRKVWVSFDVRKMGGGERQREVQRITLTALNPRFALYGGEAKQLLRALVEDARDMFLKQHEHSTSIMFSSPSDWLPKHWLDFGRRPKRSIESIHIPQKQELVEDLRWFLNNEAFYRSRSIPYRRGLLLHGPPGGGKSSLVFAIAGTLDIPVCVVDLASKQNTDLALAKMLNSAPRPSVLVYEEIDTAFCRVGSKKKFDPSLALSMGVSLEQTAKDKPDDKKDATAGGGAAVSKPNRKRHWKKRQARHEAKLKQSDEYKTAMTDLCDTLVALQAEEPVEAPPVPSEGPALHPTSAVLISKFRPVLDTVTDPDDVLLLGALTDTLKGVGWKAAAGGGESSPAKAFRDGGFRDRVVEEVAALRSALPDDGVALNVTLTKDDLSSLKTMRGVPDVGTIVSELKAFGVWSATTKGAGADDGDEEEDMADEAEDGGGVEETKGDGTDGGDANEVQVGAKDDGGPPFRESVFTMSFNGLLCALDSVTAQEGRVVVFTSNHPERIDPALLRPGRVDVVVRLGHAVAEQAGEMYHRFFKTHSYFADASASNPGLAACTRAFEARFRPIDGKFSLASVQAYLTTFMQQDAAPIEAVKKENFDAFFKVRGRAHPDLVKAPQRPTLKRSQST